MKYAILTGRLANGLAALNLLGIDYVFHGIGYKEEANSFNKDYSCVVVELSQNVFSKEILLLEQYGYVNAELRKEPRRWSGAQE